MPKDISHVTFYFNITPEGGEDTEFFFVKVDTPDAVNDDLDTWYDAALTEILSRNADVLAGAHLDGVAIKFGSAKGGTGGEFYYKIDGDSTDVDSPPVGFAQGRDLGGHGTEYSYGDLFA